MKSSVSRKILAAPKTEPKKAEGRSHRLITFTLNPDNPKSAEQIIYHVRTCLNAVHYISFRFGHGTDEQPPCIVVHFTWDSSELKRESLAYPRVLELYQLIAHGWKASQESTNLGGIIDQMKKANFVRDRKVDNKDVCWGGTYYQVSWVE